MDPFLEGEIWEDFHTEYVVALRELLVPQLGGRYVALVEARVYIEHALELLPTRTQPDIAVVPAELASMGPSPSSGSGSRPVLVSLPVPMEMRERFITVRRKDTREVVTVVELLSPTNKRKGSDGRREYLLKREATLGSGSHLVELDLLRGGERMPMSEALPEGDYYALVSRVTQRPLAEVWDWLLPDRMPVIDIPLSAGDPDVHLDLQKAFDSVYGRAGYESSVDYARTLQPPVRSEHESWLREVNSPR